jgi:hypothetical protein
MSSTSSRNTPGNYRLEQNINNGQLNYETYVNYGVPIKTFTPGNGLLPGRVWCQELAYNGIDLESNLWGIGSTNLVEPYFAPTPQFKPMQNLDVASRIPLIIPKPLVVKSGERYPI